ncbi:hypothetical protein FU659_27010 [Paenibacillus sp. N3.4]|nr:hypothetical protein FU659_27010 [Paenibacillus sp. N3.4]
MSRYELHVVSNGRLTWKELTAIAVNIHPHVTAIHIREKEKSVDEIIEGLQFLLEAGVPAKNLYLNGYPSIAADMQLGGVQMPGHMPPLPTIPGGGSRKRIGVSVHSAEEAKQREREGADYVLYGHIFRRYPSWIRLPEG